VRIEIANVLNPYTLSLAISAINVGSPEPSGKMGRWPLKSQKHPTLTVRRYLGAIRKLERLRVMNETQCQLNQALLEQMD